MFYLVIEQPASSVLWKLEWMLALGAIMACLKIKTWLAFFEHDLLKPSHLWGNLPGLYQMERTMTSSARKSFKKRLDPCYVLDYL